MTLFATLEFMLMKLQPPRYLIWSTVSTV